MNSANTEGLDVRLTRGFADALDPISGTGMTLVDEKTTVGNDGQAESVTVSFTVPTTDSNYALQFFMDQEGSNNHNHVYLDNVQLTEAGEVTWDYSVDNADIQFLGKGETITESYTVTIVDQLMLPDPISATASTEFNATYAIENLYDGNPTGVDIGTTNNLGNQYAGIGTGPHVVVYDMGAAMDFDRVFYAQRPATPPVDKVQQIEFWVTDTDPGAASTTMPILSGAADYDLTGLNEDNNLNEYAFGATLSGRYVVMRLSTVTGTANTGGSELILGNAAETTVDVVINGSNDQPEITVGGTGDSDSAVLMEMDTGLMVTGTLSVEDVDTTDVVNASVVTGVTIAGVQGPVTMACFGRDDFGDQYESGH